MRFFMSCTPEALGKLSTRLSGVRTQPLTIASRVWVQAGVFLKLWQVGVEQFDELCGINWDWLSMDEAMSHPLRWAGKKPVPIPPIAARAAGNGVGPAAGH